MAEMRVWVALVILLVFAAWALQDARRSSVTAPTTSLPESMVEAPATDRHSAFAVLHADDPAAALQRLQGPEARRLREQIDGACRALAILELDGRTEADPRRDPARQELSRRCADMPVPSMDVRTSETPLPREPEEGADSATAQQALVQLHGSRKPQELVDAWLEAYRLGALPQAQIFSDRRLLLPGEAEQLIRVVADWRECAQWNACDSDSLMTLRVCALHGCDPGSDMRAAWHQALAPRDMESALAIHAWLERWQDGPPP